VLWIEDAEADARRFFIEVANQSRDAGRNVERLENVAANEVSQATKGVSLIHDITERNAVDTDLAAEWNVHQVECPSIKKPGERPGFLSE
jgi:hypothetical protein